MFGWGGNFKEEDRQLLKLIDLKLDGIATTLYHINRDVIELKGRIETGMTVKEQVAVTKKLKAIAARLRFISDSKP